MSKLPQDIIAEILSRVPAKSLLRFKCVCNSWNSLISDPKFANLHLNHQYKTRNSQRIFLSTCPPHSVDFESYYHNPNPIRKLQYPPAIKGSYPYVVIMGSCHGIICLRENEDNVFLWNPTTNDYKELPKPINSVCGMFCYGFGYNSRLDDYQVILGIRNYIHENGSAEKTFELYSLRTNIWKRISWSNLVPFSFQGVGTYWNETLHWLTLKGGNESKQEYAIVSFDFEDEKFKEILSMPKHYDPTLYYSLSLGFSGNSLCVFCELDESFFEAHAVEKRGWSLVMKVGHEGFPGYSNKALSLSNNGEVVMDFDGYQLGFYKSNQVIEYFNVSNDWDWDSHVYLETLVSPNLFDC